MRLSRSFAFEIKPIPPYNFNLTIKKPAGWSLFNPFEIYNKNTMWTVTHVDGLLIGIKLQSKGNVRNSIISVKVFTKKALNKKEQSNLKDRIAYALGANQDLKPFYTMAAKDKILKHVVEDLYGMHDTSPTAIFPEAVLAILLQMAPLKRSNEMMASFINSYGEKAEFDGVSIKAWPTPEKASKLTNAELARKCKVGYRAKSIINLANLLAKQSFPSISELEGMEPAEAKKLLMSLPGIGDYSSDIINPHGGFPIDVWSAEVFGKLFFGREPKNNRDAVERVKNEGIKRWGPWSWMAFFYVVQDLENLSNKLGKKLRLT